MRFTQEILEKLKDSGKSVCIFSYKFSKNLYNYSYTDFPEFSSRIYYYWRKGNKAIPLQIVLKIMKNKNLKSIEIDSFSVRGGNKIVPPNEKNNAFYYILGLILGDGCLVHNQRSKTKNTYLIQISFRKKEEATKVRKLVKNLFKINPSIYAGRGCHNLCVFSKPLVLILHHKYQIPLGLKYKSMKVPDIVNKTNKKNAKAFLKGLFESDGNIYLHRGRKCIQLRQKSCSFLKEVKDLFEKVGVIFRDPYFDKANNSWLLWSSKKNLVDNFINHIVNFKIEASVAQPG